MRKYLTLIISLCLLLSVLSSCSAKGYEPDVEDSNYTDDYTYTKEESIGVTTGSEIGEIASEQKLITTVNMTLESTNFDEINTLISQKLTEANGYVEKSEQYSNYHSLRVANYTLRIPADKLNAFLESIKGSATVLNQSINTMDVTLTYADLDGKLTALRAEQEALNSMLTKASTVSETITIQDRLSEVRGEIESIEGQLRVLSSKVSYSTVTLSLNELAVAIEPIENTIWQRIAEGFSKNVENVENYFGDLFVGVVGSVPIFFAVIATILLVLIPPTVVALIIILIIKKKRKKRKNNTF